MLHKTFDLLDAKTNAETGTFEATVAVFGNVDRGGDRIMPGAFSKTLEAWKDSGDPIPVILSHQWDNPMAHIGVVTTAVETEKGLWVKGQLDVSDNDVARQVHRLMERRSLKEFSFGYDVPKDGQKRAKDGANELLELNLAEVGPTLKGMNPATELHAVKSALDATTTTADGKAFRTTGEVEVDPAIEEVMRRRSEELALELVSGGVSLRKPELPAVKSASDANTVDEVEIDLKKELQEVKARLDTLEKGLEDRKKQEAEETDKEPRARSVDPLRKRSEELTLEIASGGMSLRKPPPQVTEKKSDVDPDVLRRQSRDLMFEVLSYSTE